jgi:2-dehydro-3-deoxyphosphogluconate aldolase/(4S)-4-hydroxy-2-oxoglutarate aldolase
MHIDVKRKKWCVVLAAGVVAVGTGSDLTGPAKKGDYAGVTELAKQFVKAVADARASK